MTFDQIIENMRKKGLDKEADELIDQRENLTSGAMKGNFVRILCRNLSHGLGKNFIKTFNKK